MCISKLYVLENGKEKLLIEEVATLKVEDGKYVAVDTEGTVHNLEEYELFYIDFIGHKIVLRRR